VVLSVSENAGNAMLDAITRLMDNGHIEILSGADALIATLHLSSPAAQTATDGEIELNPIRPGIAVTGGQAATARVVGAAGAEVFLCDVGDMSSDAVIKLSTTQIRQGEPVRIHSFVLSMP